MFKITSQAALIALAMLGILLSPSLTFANKLCGCSFPAKYFHRATPHCYQPCIAGTLSCKAWGKNFGLTCTQIAPACTRGSDHCASNFNKKSCYKNYSYCMSNGGTSSQCYRSAGPNCHHYKF